MPDTRRKGSIPQWCGIILLQTLNNLGEFSSLLLGTRVANYSYRTALLLVYLESLMTVSLGCKGTARRFKFLLNYRGIRNDNFSWWLCWNYGNNFVIVCA